MMKKTIFVFIISIISVGIVFGSDVKKGTTAAQFLKITPGARSVAMGNAFVAVANDASALYWNPSGIALLNSNQVTISHAEWLADINYEFVGLAIPLGSFGTVGTAVTVLHMGDMLVTSAEDPEGQIGQTFTARDLAISISYARKLTDKFSIGFNGKYIQQTIFHSSASSYALDVGDLL